jgi:GAF domain-containing protein
MGRRAKPAKGKGKAKRPPTRKSSTNEGSARVRDPEKLLAEALEQQAATVEILRVISSSPTDVQPVFDAIAENVVRLCDGKSAVVYRFDGELIHVVAHNKGLTSEWLDTFMKFYPAPPSRTSMIARAILERMVIHVRDFDDADVSRASREMARAIGHGSTLAVPILRNGLPIGAIAVGRTDRRGAPRPFSEREIDLVKTFADQAVIAIENARMFNETQEALERQTATSEVLKVISRSTFDLQPVLDTLVENATKLCGATQGMIFRSDGEVLHGETFYGSSRRRGELIQRIELRPGLGSVVGRVALEQRAVHVLDVLSDPEYQMAEMPRAAGSRTCLGIPMLRDEMLLGVVFIWRNEVRAFTDKQIELVTTFADQAVIAIENVRLFTELQASNRELTTALDTQTATSDILRVISRSPTDVQPVFDAIVTSAVRLLGAYTGTLTRLAGDQIGLAALTSIDEAGDAAQRALFPQSLHSDGTHAQAIRDRAPLNTADAFTEPRLSEAARAFARVRGYRSLVVMPLLRHDEAIGAIGVTRREARGFTDDENALLRTFADQAVIAIENARLLSELQARTTALTRSVDELTALGDVGRVLSSTLDLETVLQTIVTRANQLTGTAGCNIWEYDEPRAEFRLRASHYADRADAARLRASGRVTAIPKGQGVTTQVMEQRQPVQIPDITTAGVYESPIRRPLIEAGHRALLGVPLLSEDEVIGVLAVTRKTPGEFEPETVRLLSTFATQSALAIQNARLFREIADKSAQLESASRHKSEFLANMSHELRTPLNAIIGFSEVLTERMFGELNEKQDEYLKDIYASGQHLLSLINDILDLSKIEAGRMELDPTDFDVPGAIDNALTLVRERAGRRGITLGRAIDERVGTMRADERKVKQVLLNLLSNALKFTPDGGRIDVCAAVNDELLEVSVADTGVGIAPEDQEAVFEEFRQVGTADKKVEGTGLGLALSRKFIELHGGRIWVKSQVGTGSTFTFTIPVRREPGDRETLTH